MKEDGKEINAAEMGMKGTRMEMFTSVSLSMERHTERGNLSGAKEMNTMESG